MAEYSQIVRTMRCRHRVRVHKWRTGMSGSAWQVQYLNGRCLRWIEAPFPRSPVSLSIFLHEIGHHVIGFDRFKQRCEEEYHVWNWALKEMHKLGVEPDDRVLNRYRLSMQYAVGKALRRGLKTLPSHLRQFEPEAA